MSTVAALTASMSVAEFDAWSTEEARRVAAEEAATRERILALHAEGLGVRRISARAGIGTSYVRKILSGPQERRPTAWKRPAKLEPQARAEARAFVHMVKTGQMTEEEAETDIGISPADRAAMEAFAERYGGSAARTVKSALAFREKVLCEFKNLCEEAQLMRGQC